MRSRLLPIALVLASAALLSPRLAVADDASPTPSTPKPVVAAAPLPLSPLGPLRATVAAASEPRQPVSAGLVIAGGVVAGAGAVGALTGLLMMTIPSSCAGSACGDTQQKDGRVTLFVGAPVLAVGLIMVIVGIQPVGGVAADGESTARARLVPAVAAGPVPGSGALRWSF